MATGTISWVKFKKDAVEFIKRSEELRDSWEFMVLQEEPGKEILMKKHVYRKMKKNCSDECKEETITMTTTDGELGLSSDSDDSLFEECRALQSSSLSGLCSYEYHIIYSDSYSLPVLYFNSYKEDGRLLTLDEIWENIPCLYQTHVKEEKWSFVTQQDHPILCRPFYQLHPCHTADVMRNVPLDWSK
uniref:Ubiquitin-like-conjugating enzyme ATG10 n=1 Tax=Saccoglossus kowalevskii TaxID=10224 RepID=A0ABM0M3K3_SACKO|nr:PREDICTED: ubiquitin-like-conjugating enzyme ATG10-like [Saccoglossus kowalevskii]